MKRLVTRWRLIREYVSAALAVAESVRRRGPTPKKQRVRQHFWTCSVTSRRSLEARSAACADVDRDGAQCRIDRQTELRPVQYCKVVRIIRLFTITQSPGESLAFYVG